MMKRVLLLFFSVTFSYGFIYSNKIGFILKREGANRFESYLYLNGRCGLAHILPYGYQLWVSCLNESEKEQAYTTLNKLVDKLIKKGYADCIFREKKNNEYISSYKTESMDGLTKIFHVYIVFKEKSITEIQMWESIVKSHIK